MAARAAADVVVRPGRPRDASRRAHAAFVDAGSLAERVTCLALRRTLLALVAFASLALASPGARADAPVRDAVREVFEDRDFQREVGTDGLSSGARNQTPMIRRRASRNRAKPELVASESGAAILWVMLVVVGGALVLWLASAAFSRLRGGGAADADAQAVEIVDVESQRDEEVLPSTLRAARALAAEGRYEEAIRALLRGALEYVVSDTRAVVVASTTSREVLETARLDDHERGALSLLVGTVEVSLFGGKAVDNADYDRCEDSFDALRAELTS